MKINSIILSAQRTFFHFQHGCLEGRRRSSCEMCLYLKRWKTSSRRKTPKVKLQVKEMLVHRRWCHKRRVESEFSIVISALYNSAGTFWASPPPSPPSLVKKSRGSFQVKETWIYDFFALRPQQLLAYLLILYLSSSCPRGRYFQKQCQRQTHFELNIKQWLENAKFCSETHEGTDPSWRFRKHGWFSLKLQLYKCLLSS